MLERIEPCAAGTRPYLVHYGTALSSIGQDFFKILAVSGLSGGSWLAYGREQHLVESNVR
jgi:hypothetical protein